MKSGNSYDKIITALKRRKKGAVAADISADTALPLHEVRQLLPKAADEYSGHLQVTESGEIMYTFPDGFTSRYRGAGVKLKKIAVIFFKGLKITSVFLFKIWIMIMLIGYFLLFIAIALGAVVLSMAAQSKSSDRRSAHMGPNLFGIIWRIWFVSEITRPRYGYQQVPVTQKEKGRPMHKAIFSFVFGEGDPNKNWNEMQDKTIISYIQSNNGVISIVEYMVFSGKNSLEAEKDILSFCARFGGSPEVTEEGTIVYRFDELLLRSDSRKFAELSPPVKRLKTFSDNKKNKNIWFIVINAVNLFFGSYFLYNAITTGFLLTEIQYQAASYLYAIVHWFLHAVTLNPPAVIGVVLGAVPFVFSLLFWLIPAIRKYMENKENEEIKLSNFKSFSFSKIWAFPLNVDNKKITPAVAECRPKNLEMAADIVIKELGVISNPEVKIGSKGETLYSFEGLKTEKQALKKYRDSLDPKRAELGKTVFDSSVLTPVISQDRL